MDLIADADAAASQPPCGIATEAASAAAAAAPSIFCLDEQTASKVPAATKKSLKLGILGEIAHLTDEWQGEYPETLPFDADVVQAGGKVFETLASFTAGTKGTKDPISINTEACNTGISVLESIARVLLSCEPGIGMSEKPFAALAEHIKACKTGLRRSPTCEAADLQIVMLVIATRGFRARVGRAARPYAGVDQQVLDILTRISGLKGRLDRWGYQVAQLFVDFYRTIGELAVQDSWEKRATLNEQVVFSKIRHLVYFYPDYQLGDDAFKSLWVRATTKK